MEIKGIFKEARESEKIGMGYRARRFKILWKSKSIAWNFIMLSWGIRWSDKWQIFPIWNVSDNCNKSIMIGFWKLYFQISYARANNCHYLFKMPFYNKLRDVYLLLF